MMIEGQEWKFFVWTITEYDKYIDNKTNGQTWHHVREIHLMNQQWDNYSNHTEYTQRVLHHELGHAMSQYLPTVINEGEFYSVFMEKIFYYRNEICRVEMQLLERIKKWDKKKL